MSADKKVKSEADKLKSVLVIVTGFLVLYFVFKSPVLFYIAVGVGIASLASQVLMNGILWVWDMIALVLGWVNTRILLAVVFYLFLYPLALVHKLSAKNQLRLRNKDASTFDTRNHLYTREDLENTW